MPRADMSAVLQPAEEGALGQFCRMQPGLRRGNDGVAQRLLAALATGVRLRGSAAGMR
jgi:hypothetical protein